MKIELEADLRELIEKGQNRRYKTIAQNKVLYSGLMRAYQIMEATSTVNEL